MNRENLLTVSIGFLCGVIVTVLITSQAVKTGNTSAMKVLGIQTSIQKNSEDAQTEDDFLDTSQSLSSEDKLIELMSKTGAEFEKQYLQDISQELQSIFDLSNEATSSAKRQEVKDFAFEMSQNEIGQIEKVNQLLQSENTNH